MFKYIDLPCINIPTMSDMGFILVYTIYIIFDILDGITNPLSVIV